jgi:hypothetical protein
LPETQTPARFGREKGGAVSSEVQAADQARFTTRNGSPEVL